MINSQEIDDDLAVFKGRSDTPFMPRARTISLMDTKPR